MLPNVFDLPAGETHNLKQIPAVSGVYLLTDEADRPILLAHAADIRRAVRHRLTAPPDEKQSKRANLAAIVRRVHWVETFSPFETTWIHSRVAREKFPDSYRDLIGFASVWFLHIDPAAAFPRFTAVERRRDDGAVYIGPVAAQRDADEWIHMLEDVFDLCRYHHVLEKAPHGERCAYFDMGKCPAPCDGTIGMDRYRDMVRAALAFTLGDREERLTSLRTAMQLAATELQFERAAAIRRTVERCESTVENTTFARMRDVVSFQWLVVQRAGRRSRDPRRFTIKPFFVTADAIEAGEAVGMEDVDRAAVDWAERGRRAVPIETSVPIDAISLLGRFLFQPKPGGIFLRLDSSLQADDVARSIRAFAEESLRVITTGSSEKADAGE